MNSSPRLIPTGAGDLAVFHGGGRNGKARLRGVDVTPGIGRKLGRSGRLHRAHAAPVQERKGARAARRRPSAASGRKSSNLLLSPETILSLKAALRRSSSTASAI